MSGPVASLTSSIGPGGTVVPPAGHSTENGPERQTSRDVGKNSNARVVRAPIGSGFIAAIDRWTAETFSPDFGSQAGNATADRHVFFGCYFGANPKVRSKRLA